MIRIARAIVGGIGRGLYNLFLAVVALALIGGVIAIGANYQATQGSGTTFASAVISAVNYVEFLLCDATLGTAQCAAVDSSGRVAIQAPPTLPLPSGAATSANQTNASQKSQIVDGSGNVIASTSNALNVDVTNSNANGQTTMAGSSPVAIASNQTLPWTGSLYNNTTPTSASMDGFIAGNAEPGQLASNGQMAPALVGLESKLINLPYSVKEKMLRGFGTSTGNSAANFTGIGWQGAAVKVYLTAIQCGRDDTNSTPIYVTINDSASTELVLPNSGGGGGNNAQFPVPLSFAANTTPTFTPSQSITTIRCAAQGYSGS